MGKYIINKAVRINNFKEGNRLKLPFRKNTEGYFFDNKRNILARQTKDYICFPGGGINNTEKSLDAIIRETFEETGAKITNLKEIGKLKFMWGKDWVKNKKQKERYKQFQGEEMYLFSGDILKFENPSHIEEDFWKGTKLMNINKVIKIIESEKPFSKHLKKYREMQLKFLKTKP